MRPNQLTAVLISLSASILLCACSDRADETTARDARSSQNEPPAPDDSPGQNERSSADEQSAGDAVECLRGAPFVSDGAVPIDSGAPGTAGRVRSLRWENYDGCGRFVIDFAKEDNRPAETVGDVRAAVLRELGVVRIELPDVEHVHPDATEASFDGLAAAAYSVWSNEGRWVFVDLHLAAEAEAYVAVLEDPARVLVDLRPGGPPLPPPPASDVRIVVLEPREPQQTYPLTVSGYARTFEANVVARLERDGEMIEETFTTATAWVDAWGHYSMTFEDGPSGPLQLHVGEYSARDGAWEGAVVNLDMQ